MLRRIKPELPKIIVEEVEEKFFDVATGYLIAVEEVELYGKSREVMVAYIEREENVVKLLTIHPLKKRQKKNRVKNREIEKDTMKDFKIFYDEEDILYLSKKGQEEEVVELAPGVNVELDVSGELIGIEFFKASNLFKDVIKLMDKKLSKVA